jgi:hypothetical protein
MEESNKAFATTASQSMIFKNNVTELGDAIGGPLVAGFNAVLPPMTDFVQQLKGLAEGEQSTGWVRRLLDMVPGLNVIPRGQEAKDSIDQIFGPQPDADNVYGRRDYSTHQSGTPSNEGEFDIGRGQPTNIGGAMTSVYGTNAAGDTYVVNGNVNVGVSSNVPGGIDPNAGIAVVSRVDYTGAGRYAE